MSFEEGVLIQNLLLAAKEDLAYSGYIINYVKNTGQTYNPSQNIDQFYKKVCNLSFYDALLIVVSLLDDKDNKPISFKNWKKFKDDGRIKKIRQQLETGPLKNIRKRMIAHQDAGFNNLFIINSRRWGMVADEYVKMLEVILENLIQIFVDIENARGSHLSESVTFDVSSATQEIRDVMASTPPYLTRDLVI